MERSGTRAPFLRTLGKLTGSRSVTFVRGEFACRGTGYQPDRGGRTSTRLAQGPAATPVPRALAGHAGGGIYSADAADLRPLQSSRRDDLASVPVEPAHALILCIAQLRHRGAFLRLVRPALWVLSTRTDCSRSGGSRGAWSRLPPALAPQVMEAQAAQPTLHHHGMFVLDARWRWVGGDPIADRMVADGWWQGRRHAHLEGIHAVTRRAGRQCSSGFSGWEDGDRHVIPCAMREGALVALADVHASRSMPRRTVPRYLLFVRPLQVPNSEAIAGELRQCSGLTVGKSPLVCRLRKKRATPRPQPRSSGLRRPARGRACSRSSKSQHAWPGRAAGAARGAGRNGGVKPVQAWPPSPGWLSSLVLRESAQGALAIPPPGLLHCAIPLSLFPRNSDVRGYNLGAGPSTVPETVLRRGRRRCSMDGRQSLGNGGRPSRQGASSR